MPVMTDRRSVAANATVDNVLVGSIFEFLSMHALVEIACVALSSNLGDIRANISSGTDLLAENWPLTVRNTGVNLNDDPIRTDAALAGERLKVSLRNTTPGTNIDVHTFIRVTPR